MLEKCQKKLKKDEGTPVDWSEYIRQAIEDRIDTEERKRILREVKELLKDVPKAHREQLLNS